MEAQQHTKANSQIHMGWAAMDEIAMSRDISSPRIIFNWKLRELKSFEHQFTNK